MLDDLLTQSTLRCVVTCQPHKARVTRKARTSQEEKHEHRDEARSFKRKRNVKDEPNRVPEHSSNQPEAGRHPAKRLRGKAGPQANIAKDVYGKAAPAALLEPRVTRATGLTKRYGRRGRVSSPIPSMGSDVDYDEVPVEPLAAVASGINPPLSEGLLEKVSNKTKIKTTETPAITCKTRAMKSKSEKVTTMADPPTAKVEIEERIAVSFSRPKEPDLPSEDVATKAVDCVQPVIGNSCNDKDVKVSSKHSHDGIILKVRCHNWLVLAHEYGWNGCTGRATGYVRHNRSKETFSLRRE